MRGISSTTPTALAILQAFTVNQSMKSSILALFCLCKQADVCIPDSLTKIYQKDINYEQLKLQLRMIPDLILRYKELTGITIKKVTNIRSVCEVLNSYPVLKCYVP